MNLKKHSLTFFSLLSIIGIIVGIPLGFYGLTLTGGASLYGEVIFAVVIGLIFLLLIDRLLIQVINSKKLSIIEIGISIILLSIFLIRID